MITTEIYIERQRLDLYKDISAEFTYTIDDVKDFAARNTNFSKTIIIPGNATNNKIFGHIFEFGSANFYNPNQSNVGYNFNPSVSASCVIFVNKIQIFKGILRLLEITIDKGVIDYECVVFGELGGFVSALGNSKIEELDFSAYDQAWNISNIHASWNNIVGNGVYFPLIDYGLVSTNKHDWQFNAMRPAFYVAELVDKIITGSGYTYDSDFFTSDLCKRLVVPNNQKVLSAYSTIGFAATIDASFYGAAGNPTPEPALSLTATTSGSFTGSVSNSKWTYTGAATITGSFTINIVGYKYGIPNADVLYFALQKNDTTNLNNVSGDSSIGGDTPFDFTFVTEPVSFATGDFFDVQSFWQDWISGLGMDWDIYSGSVTFNLQSTQLVPLNYNETIVMNSILPRGIFQKDFFASIVKMFNLYVLESKTQEKHLIIEPYIDFYKTDPMFLQVNAADEELLVDNTDLLLLHDAYVDYLDWTYKVDRSKPFKIKPMSELNGRYFEYKYQSDADYYNDQYTKKYVENYADYIEDTGYEFAKEKQTAQLIFASTPIVGYLGEDKVYSTMYKLNGVIEEQIDTKIRILQAKKLTGYTNYDILNGAAILTTQDYIGYAGHLDDPDNPAADINFGSPKELYYTLATTYPSANLFNGFWSDYVAEITDKNSKLMQCNVLLNDMDIYSLDFAKLIYIDGSLWRLNKIIDYNPMDYTTTKCEFLKVIEITYE